MGQLFRKGRAYRYLAILCWILACLVLGHMATGQQLVPEWVWAPLVAISLAMLGVLFLQLTAVEREATVDILTGSMTRRALHRDLDRFTQRGEPFGLIFIDVDGLKQINDTHGHSAGDELLQRAADCICRSSRPSDLVYRYGGDEFVVLVPGADAKLTATICARITNTAGEGVLSAGSAACPDDGFNGLTLLASADLTMYQLRSQRRSATRPDMSPHTPAVYDIGAGEYVR
ncbi:MAG: diguanylate cyclase [Firmicutes bacterium]|nr:diguanylate cyclase [Bacillota bacterium]